MPFWVLPFCLKRLYFRLKYDWRKICSSRTLKSLLEKMMSAARAAAVVEICKVEGGKYTAIKTIAIEWFRRFNNGEATLEVQLKSGRPSTDMYIETQPRDLVKQQPQTSNLRLLAELGPPRSTIASRYLNKIALVNRRCCCREVPHELTEDQQQRQQRQVNGNKLLENPTDSRFWRRHRIVTCDEKWIIFRNAANREHVWLKPAAQPTTVPSSTNRNVSLRRWSCCVFGEISKGYLITLGLFKMVQWTQHYATVNNWMTAFTSLSWLVIQQPWSIGSRPCFCCNMTMLLLLLRRHTLMLLSSKQKPSSRLPSLNFFPLIQHLALMLCHPTIITCSAPWRRKWTTAGTSILWKPPWNTVVVESCASNLPEWYRRGIELLAHKDEWK